MPPLYARRGYGAPPAPANDFIDMTREDPPLGPSPMIIDLVDAPAPGPSRPKRKSPASGKAAAPAAKKTRKVPARRAGASLRGDIAPLLEGRRATAASKKAASAVKEMDEMRRQGELSSRTRHRPVIYSSDSSAGEWKQDPKWKPEHPTDPLKLVMSVPAAKPAGDAGLPIHKFVNMNHPDVLRLWGRMGINEGNVTTRPVNMVRAKSPTPPPGRIPDGRPKRPKKHPLALAVAAALREPELQQPLLKKYIQRNQYKVPQLPAEEGTENAFRKYQKRLDDLAGYIATDILDNGDDRMGLNFTLPDEVAPDQADLNVGRRYSSSASSEKTPSGSQSKGSSSLGKRARAVANRRELAMGLHMVQSGGSSKSKSKGSRSGPTHITDGGGSLADAEDDDEVMSPYVFKTTLDEGLDRGEDGDVRGEVNEDGLLPDEVEFNTDFMAMEGAGQKAQDNVVKMYAERHGMTFKQAVNVINGITDTININRRVRRRQEQVSGVPMLLKPASTSTSTSTSKMGSGSGWGSGSGSGSGLRRSASVLAADSPTAQADGGAGAFMSLADRLAAAQARRPNKAGASRLGKPPTCCKRHAGAAVGLKFR